MRSARFARCVAAGSLLALAVLGTTARAQERVTVLLKDGQKYEQVTYQVHRGFNTLELRSGERNVQVSFADIEAITDASGNNIAPRILGTRYRPSNHAAPRAGETSAAALAGPDSAAEARATPTQVEPSAFRLPRPWKMALTLDGGFDSPFGDYYDGTRSGLGFGGTLHAAVTDEFALRGDVTLLGVRVSDGFRLVSLDPSVEIVSQSYDIDGLRILVGGEYYQSIQRAGGWSGFWYAHGSLGVIRHRITGQLTVRNPGTGQVAELSPVDTQSKFTMTSGFGVVYRVAPRLGVNFSGDLDGVWTKVYYPNGSTGVGMKGLVLGVHAGIALIP